MPLTTKERLDVIRDAMATTDVGSRAQIDSTPIIRDVIVELIALLEGEVNPTGPLT
jgi:hypothetical protein